MSTLRSARVTRVDRHGVVFKKHRRTIDSWIKLRVAPESIIACKQEARIETDRWTRFEVDADVDVRVACLSTPTSAEAETASFPI